MDAKKPLDRVTSLAIILAILLVGLFFYIRTEKAERRERAAVEATQRKQEAQRVQLEEQRRREEAWQAGAEQRRIDNAREQQQRARQQLREETAQSIAALTEIAQRFSDQNQIAASTPRIALAPIVQQMQATARQAATITVSPCMYRPKLYLVGGMNDLVSVYLSFMRQEGTTTGTANAKHNLDAYKKEMEACAKDAF